MIAAAPRKNANGDCDILPYRIGRSSFMRPLLLESTRILMGSGRSLRGCQPAWLCLLTLVRSSLPAAALRSRDTEAGKAPFEECMRFEDVVGFMTLPEYT